VAGRRAWAVTYHVTTEQGCQNGLVCRHAYVLHTFCFVSPSCSFSRYAPAAPNTSRGVLPERAKSDVVALCAGWGSPSPEIATLLAPGDIHVGELWSMPPRQVGAQSSQTRAVGAGPGVETLVRLPCGNEPKPLEWHLFVCC
jgi:hypothetical protein